MLHTHDNAMSIALIGLLAFTSMFLATLVRRPWQRYTILGCAAAEVAMVIVLIMVAR